jgi:hypothetical protein
VGDFQGLRYGNNTIAGMLAAQVSMSWPQARTASQAMAALFPKPLTKGAGND